MTSPSERQKLLRATASQQFLSRLFVAPNRAERVGVAVFSAFVLLSVAAIVWFTGGTKYPYLHLLYIPVFASAFFFGPVGGIGTGVLAGLLIGPYMPQDVVLGVPQSLMGWLFRSTFFTLAGGITGFISSMLRNAMVEAIMRGLVDAPTGLPNNQSLIRQLGSKERHEPISTIYSIQLRAFRSIAVAFGMDKAQSLLNGAIARLLPLQQGKGDGLFRGEGSTLLVLSPREWSLEEVSDLSEILSEPVEVEGVPLQLDPVIGVAQMADSQLPAETLLRRAAMASDAAVSSGRNWSLYAEESDSVLQDRLRLLGDLRQGLHDSAQIILHYQPKIRLDNHQMIGCEALVRWHHPRLGLLSPARFIPIVEHSSLINRLTETILRIAVTRVAQWREMGERIPVSVNMSARDLSVPSMVHTTLDLIKTYKIEHGLIDVEVTESAAFLQEVELGEQLAKLRDAGVSLSIDDYGTGMSSLSYLKRIPATHVKIDQMFIRNVAHDRRDQVLVESTVRMCRKMGLTTIAEGVEDEDCARVLNAMGCDMAQGYYFARPLTAEGLLAFWRENQAAA